MTETRVNILQDMELTPDVLIGMQDGPENSLDHVVGDTLIPDRGYAGMAASYAGTVVTIGTGRLYQGGKVYAFDTAQTFDVLAKSKLPVATRRIMLLLAYGTEQDSAPEQINFLVEAQSTPSAPVYKPQAMAVQHQRLAIVQDAYGDEAPNPVYPGYGLALPVAVAVLGPTGIISLQNIVDGKVPNLADVASRTKALESFEATIGPEVSTLAATLAGLANAAASANYQALLSRMLLSVAALDAKVGIPSTAADSSMDYLLDRTNSDLTHPLSNCKVTEGIRFADDGAADQVLNIFNPYETAGVVKGGVLFPAYDRYLRTAIGPQTGSVAANSYTYNPVSYTQKTMTRQRVRYGTAFDVCTNSTFWGSGTYDPITGIFTLPDGETFLAALDPLDGAPTGQGSGTITTRGVIGYVGADGTVYQHEMLRLEEFWTDSVSETYWDAVVQAPQVIAGYHLAESMIIGQDQWLDAVGIFLPKLDAQGGMTLLVCKAGLNARPDPSSVLARVDVPYASLVAGGETVVPLATPVLLDGGDTISIVLVTTAAHQVATTDGANFPDGTFFVLSPSGYDQGDLTKHLCLNLYGAKFRQAVTSINLQNLQLAGGMTAIDILASGVVPASASRTYEVQLAGVWVPLASLTTGQLNSGGALPPNVPLRVTFAGTSDMQPCLDLGHSNAHVSRPKTSLAHVWPATPRTPPVPSSQIRVIERYEGYDPAQHSWAAKLLTGANYLTQTAPSSFSDVITDDGALERTYVFNLGAAVSSYQVLTLGTAVTPLDVDLGAWIKDYCL